MRSFTVPLVTLLTSLAIAALGAGCGGPAPAGEDTLSVDSALRVGSCTGKETACGSKCCSAGTPCVQGTFGPVCQPTDAARCHGKQSVCGSVINGGDQGCCPANTSCFNNSPSDTFCAASPSSAGECPANSTACPASSPAVCCPSGSTCTQDGVFFSCR